MPWQYWAVSNAALLLEKSRRFSEKSRRFSESDRFVDHLDGFEYSEEGCRQIHAYLDRINLNDS
jgi:hypothetical protein